MKPVIYYRHDRDVSSEAEEAAMAASFRVVQSRMDVEEDELVIARYSALPFYQELEKDLSRKGARLINSYRQHRWIANLGDWYYDLEGMTPQTWHRLDMVPDDAFPVVVKGETNSKKFLWDTHMFAKTRRDAANVMCNLMDDGIISGQPTFFRKYVPLKTYLVGLRGLPVTKEFRVFVCNRQILSIGYYWSNYDEDLPEKPNPDDVPRDFLRKVIGRVGNRAPFYAVDVAETASGDWIVIELNDGQMSGLSENDPAVLYPALRAAIP